MHLVDKFLNPMEEIVFNELSSVASDNSLRAFPKPRMSDVLVKGTSHLSSRVFDFYTRSHFDFLITDASNAPFMAVEYDGPYHTSAKQGERDTIKNELCQDGGLPLLRIGARHVTQKFRGMTLLRWIIEVMQLQRCFDEAQAKGQVPHDEPFDPAMIISDGSGREWPYWLSLDANERINRFFGSQSGAKRLSSMQGIDALGNMHSFAYLRVENDFLYTKTAARGQGYTIPVFDMLDQVAHYELGIELERYLKGERRMMPLVQFKPIHDRICAKCKMHGGTTEPLFNV